MPSRAISSRNSSSKGKTPVKWRCSGSPHEAKPGANSELLSTFLEFIELREYGGGERWCENGSREKLALRFYLAKTIVERTPSTSSIPQLYIDFAGQLHERDIVISLNWDSLLEIALE